MKAVHASTFASILLFAVVGSAHLKLGRSVVDPYSFEITVTAVRATAVQLFFDQGAGYSEIESRRYSVNEADHPTEVRFAIPAGVYRSIRLDPLDGEGTIILEGATMRDSEARVLHRLAPGEFKGAHQVASLQVDSSRLRVITTTGATDPQLELTFNPALTLPESLAAKVTRSGALPAALIASMLLLLVGCLNRFPSLQAFISRVAKRGASSPQGSIALAAAVAAIASAYPVVFLGKSYVSPDVGTTLLYGKFPTLPGYQSEGLLDTKGSDVGAIMWQHIAYSAIQHRALRGGELPLWNRYNSMGSPLLGQGQSMFGDLLHWLPVVANGAAWAWDAKYVVAKWLFAVGLGLGVLALTGSRPAALIVALSAPFVGFFVYRINHPAFFTLCYSPWILLAWFKIAAADEYHSVVRYSGLLLLANGCTLSSGTIKEAYALITCLNFSGAMMAAFYAPRFRAGRAKLLTAAAALVLFIAAAAPVWSVFWATLRHGYTAYAPSIVYQIQPSLLLGSFDEIFYRPLSKLGHVYNPSINLLLGFGLLYFGATLRGRIPGRAISFLAASSILPFSLAFGVIPAAGIAQVPLLRNIWHIDNCFSCVLVVQWSVLAGVGFAAMFRPAAPRERRSYETGAAVGLVVLVFLWSAFFQGGAKPFLGGATAVSGTSEGFRIPVYIWLYLGSSLAALGVFCWSARDLVAGRVSGAEAAVALLLGMSVILWKNGLHVAGVGRPEYTVQPKTRVDFLAKSEAVEQLRTALVTNPARVVGVQGNLFPGWNGIYGLETVSGVDAISSKYLNELNHAIADWQVQAAPVDSGRHLMRPFLDLYNVRYYAAAHTDRDPWLSGLKETAAGDLAIWESAGVWPRAFFTDRVLGYDEVGEFTRVVALGDGQPFAAARRQDMPGHFLLRDSPSDLAGRVVVPATRYELSENTTSFEVNATGPGIVVLAETLWPGDFVATVDGEEVPVLRLNHAFKGVSIDGAGKRRVSFIYLPRDFIMYKGISLAAAALALGGWGASEARHRARDRRRRKHRSPSVEAALTL